MYHKTVQDRADKRLIPPPHEVWMEAIMNKGRASDGCIPTDTKNSSSRNGKEKLSLDWISGDSMPQQLYASEEHQTANVTEILPSYQRRGIVNTGYEGNLINNYQGQPVDEIPIGSMRSTVGAYPGRNMDRTADYRDNLVNEGPAYQKSASQGRGMKKVTSFHGARAHEDTIENESIREKGSAVDKPFGKTKEDYKKNRQLSPRMEAMIREQVNLNEAVLHNAFTVAMDNLIPEVEANYIASGRCHLCEKSDTRFISVVNFCPHVEEDHSFCREHLRSVYRVRMETLFFGKKGLAPNRRMLRCLVCTRGCPCPSCSAEKEKEVGKYKRYLLDTLHCNEQGSAIAAKEKPRFSASAHLMADEKTLSAGADHQRHTRSSPQSDKRHPSPRKDFSAHSVETHEPFPADKQSNHDDLLAQSKSQHPPVPKRAAKETAPHRPLRSTLDNSQLTHSGKVPSPQARQDLLESPSAATVLNCTESEKSLAQLLSSLNQGRGSTALVPSNSNSQSNKMSANRTNSVPNVENEINGQPFSDVEYLRRGIADRRVQMDRVHRDNSSTEFDTESLNAGVQSDEKSEVRKIKTRTKSYNRGNPVPQQDSNEAQSEHRGGRVSNDKLPRQSEVSTKKVKAVKELPPLSQRPPGSLRKLDGGAVRGERKPHQERKATSISKKNREKVEQPKRAKRVKRDEQKEKKKEVEETTKGGEEDGSDSEVDTNLDFCEVCQCAGDLVCCDRCPRSFHLKCLHMTENDLPEGDWQCSDCKKPSQFDAYSVAVASERTLLDKCLKIVECLKSHSFSKPFRTPVQNIPLYARVVKQPMDLSTIETKLKKGAYLGNDNSGTSSARKLDATYFANDVRLIWSNCKLFNDDGSGITRAAETLSAGFERLYNETIEPQLKS